MLSWLVRCFLCFILFFLASLRFAWLDWSVVLLSSLCFVLLRLASLLVCLFGILILPSPLSTSLSPAGWSYRYNEKTINTNRNTKKNLNSGPPTCCLSRWPADPPGIGKPKCFIFIERNIISWFVLNRKQRLCLGQRWKTQFVKCLTNRLWKACLEQQ